MVLDVLKLEDAISVHEHTKLHLELYSKENNVPLVKPFILVVCRNIQHAKETVELIENRIYDGKYKGKVLQIDSSTKKNDEIDQQFVSLEDPNNKIEIVVPKYAMPLITLRYHPLACFFFASSPLRRRSTPAMPNTATR